LEIRVQEPQEMPRRAEPRQLRTSQALAGAYGETEALPATGTNGTATPPRPRPQPMRRAAAAVIDPNDPTTWGKVPRNVPCPCGSGKKYKHCHGRLA
ncbi:MAG: SEC-C metal-binding domain-containing protein, partial [Alphaproteobacteria bacterium]